MIARGRTVGVLAADNKVSRAPIPPQTVELLQSFAAQAAVAVENARLFQEIQDKGRELEVASRHKSQFLANMSHEPGRPQRHHRRDGDAPRGRRRPPSRTRSRPTSASSARGGTSSP